jgi:hypothetical protein
LSVACGVVADQKDCEIQLMDAWFTHLQKMFAENYVSTGNNGTFDPYGAIVMVHGGDAKENGAS